MAINAIWSQLVTTYEKTNMAIISENNGKLRIIYNSNEMHETLFERVKECQEVTILGGSPYTPEQILNIVTHLLKCAAITQLSSTSGQSR